MNSFFMTEKISMGQEGYTIINFIDNIPAEIWASLIIMLIICIVTVIIGRKAKKYNPLTRPKSILVIFGEFVVGGISDFVEKNIGPEAKKFAPYFGMIVLYMPFAFVASLIGLPAPFTHIAVPLSLALMTFIAIHLTAIIQTGIKGWSSRFVKPIFFFLPINLISMWAPVISLTCRILGNALAGSIIMTLIYWATSLLSSSILAVIGLPEFNFIAPIVTPLFHAYFDIFSCFIQTLVFVSLSAILMSAEIPREENI